MEETTFLHSLQPISVSSFQTVTPYLPPSPDQSLLPLTSTTMKRHIGSDPLIPIRSPPGTYPPVYDGMDDDDLGEDEMCSSGHAGSEKKRRLSTDQVRALEKNFEVENRLDPERKVRLAQELALQPRQVAVWFQNRRARWKTKQLERDYTALKSSYDALRHDLDALRHTNHSLVAEIKQLKSKLGEEESYDDSSVKVEPESDVKAASETEEPAAALILKDGSSEYSDSSAVLNDDTNSPAIFSASGATFRASDAAAGGAAAAGIAMGFSFQYQLLKAEEEDYDEPCSSSFFSDEQPPTLPWCYSEQWSWMDPDSGNIHKREGLF